MLTKKEIRKKYGLRLETFKFYLKVGAINKLGSDNYELTKKFYSLILDKDSVFRFSFVDSWKDDLIDFQKFINKTGKVKIYTKKEIEKYEKERKNDNNG